MLFRSSFVGLIACVIPHAWGYTEPAPEKLGLGEGWLIFTHAWDIHQQVATFLSHLRSILSSPESTNVVSVVSNPESDKKLRAALEHSLALELKITPLRDLLVKLQEEFDIPIVLSAKKLEEAAVSPDTPIACSLPQAPLKTQLRALLDPLQLTYTIRDEVLIITTPEDAESQLIIRLYDIRQLLSAGVSGEQLYKQLITDVNPPNWDRNGGPGTASIYRGILVVNHTGQIHEDIEKWLADLRAKLPLPMGEGGPGTPGPGEGL